MIAHVQLYRFCALMIEKKAALDFLKLSQRELMVWSEVYFMFPLYINWSITKKFPIETLLEMMDSSVKTLGKSKYDKQNWLQHQKTEVLLNNLKWGLLPVLIVHQLVHNKKVHNWNTFGNDGF